MATASPPVAEAAPRGGTGRGEFRLDPRPPQDCTFESANPQPVQAIIDSENLLLKTGGELNLGVLTASLEDAAAISALQDLVIGRAVTLARPPVSGKETADRYTRLHANATVQIGSDSVWLQGALVARGLARALIEPASACGRSDLLILENKARHRKEGHWATGVFKVLDAHNAAAVAAFDGRFAIIQGRPRRTSKSRKGTYYNFGRNWREDVTVFVPSRLTKKKPAHQPIRSADTRDDKYGARKPDPRATDRQLRSPANTRLRARGWIELRGGPLIEIRDLDQLEWIE